ncbi:hypothetical protein ACSHXN_45335 (plasmid) [Streptomyces sp. HUAS TT11]|uniref:hypothetical protein n=1 Tax=Streptomyces sp. HUAS TT11 TaxID=3447508 RepID=UPI003F65DDA6
MTRPIANPTDAHATEAGLRSGATKDELEGWLQGRGGTLRALQRGPRAARTIADLQTPPPGLRDLSALAALMRAANDAEADYLTHPGWTALSEIYRRASHTLGDLANWAARTPQAAVQATRITALAAGLISRHAAQVTAFLVSRGKQETPGAQALRNLTKVAETLAARAVGLDHGQKLDTPRLLRTHLQQLNRALQGAEAGHPGPATDPKLTDPDDPDLHYALTIGAVVDPELSEAAAMMGALSDLASSAGRIGHRMVLDVRLHGMIETAQIRGFEMISGIAYRVMKRYDKQGREGEGRRDIAAMIFRYAEQRLERMRGALGPDEGRDPGYYEIAPLTATLMRCSTSPAASPPSCSLSTCCPRTGPRCRSGFSWPNVRSRPTPGTRSGASEPTPRRSRTRPACGQSTPSAPARTSSTCSETL